MSTALEKIDHIIVLELRASLFGLISLRKDVKNKYILLKTVDFKKYSTKIYKI